MRINNTLNDKDRALFTKALKLNRNDPWALCIEILLRTGMRTEELTKMDPIEDVNVIKGTIFVHAAKGSKDRYVPIDQDFARKIIEDLKDGVIKKFGRIKTSFKRQLAREFDAFKLKTLGFGYQDLTLHGLRAAFAQAVYQNCDNDIMLVRDLLGHCYVQTTMAYMKGLTFEDKFKKIKGAI